MDQLTNDVVPILVVLVCSVIASFTDISRFKVYNTLTIPCFLGGLIYGLVINGWAGLGFALGGSLAGFFILLLPYLMGGLGAGDVKFVMAIGSWIGPYFLLPAIIVGCFVVFAYFLVAMGRKHGKAGVVYSLKSMFLRLSCFGRNLAFNDQYETVQEINQRSEEEKRGRLIPFSAMMSCGVAVVLLIAVLSG